MVLLREDSARGGSSHEEAAASRAAIETRGCPPGSLARRLALPIRQAVDRPLAGALCVPRPALSWARSARTAGNAPRNARAVDEREIAPLDARKRGSTPTRPI